MVDFACDDRVVERAFRRLCERFTAHGGLIYDKLIMGVKNGSFVIRAPKSKKDGQKILVAPKHILLPVDKYDLALEGDDFVMKGHDKSLSRGQVEIMESMLELYNLTGKIRQIKATSTIGAYYSDRALHDIIMKGHFLNSPPFLESMKKLSRGDFWIDAFMKSRVLGFQEKVPVETDQDQEAKPKAKGADGRKQGEGGSERVQMLMPIIDFLNHHPGAHGFFTSFREIDSSLPPLPKDQAFIISDGVSVLKSCPVKGSDECYVSYGHFEAMDTLIHYNYPERNAQFVRSVPLQVKVPGAGTLNINAFAGFMQHKKLPDQIKDLRFYMPAIGAAPARRTVGMSFLIIPQKGAPRALRRVLAVALSRIGVEMQGQILMDSVLYAEKRILEANLQYYDKLEAFLHKHKAKPATKAIIANAREVIKIQREKIKNYPFFAEAMTGDSAPVTKAQKKAPRKKVAARKIPKKKTRGKAPAASKSKRKVRHKRRVVAG